MKVEVICPRGEAIRNWAYGEFPSHLDAQLRWRSVIPSTEARELLARCGEVIELSETPSHPVLNRVRVAVESAHNDWLEAYLDNEASRYRTDVHHRHASTRTQRTRVRIESALRPLRARRETVTLLARAERALAKAHARRDRPYTGELPDLVFNGSHVHSRNAQPFLDHAAVLNIPTATFLFSWDNLTSQGRLLAPHDWYFTWNSTIASDLVRIYPEIAPERVIVTGTPQFDQHRDPHALMARDEFCGSVGLDPSRPYILYTTGMANHMPAEEQVVEYLADLLTAHPDRPQLFLRVYPKDQTGRFAALLDRRRDIVASPNRWWQEFLTPQPEDGQLWTNSLHHCAGGVNVASTVSLELALFDKPIINIGFTPSAARPIDYARYYRFDHYRQILAYDAIELVTERSALNDAIDTAIRQPDARRSQRSSLVEGFFEGLVDGHAARRVATSLNEILRDLSR